MLWDFAPHTQTAKLNHCRDVSQETKNLKFRYFEKNTEVKQEHRYAKNKTSSIAGVLHSDEKSFLWMLNLLSEFFTVVWYLWGLDRFLRQGRGLEAW